MKVNRSYRFITLVLIGLLSIAFSQTFATVVKVEKAKKEQAQDKETDKQSQPHEHVLKAYEAVISVDQHIHADDISFLPANEFPDEVETERVASEQLNTSVLSYFEVLFETSICTNAP